MDHRGHAKRPLSRDALPILSLVESFISETQEEDPALAKSLDSLDEQGRHQLGGILGRFDQYKKGALDAHQRLLARRVISRLHRHTEETLLASNQILDYLDLNQSALLEENELELCVQVFELFSKADSVNDTLSSLELEMLYATLRYLDANSDGKLDSLEREQLIKGLSDPELFFAKQKALNPLLKEVLKQAGR